jgi:O-antigen/teichoic acid export membrane protein
VVRRFFRDSALYAVPAAVSAGASFLTFPLFAHHFAPRAYGTLDLLAFTSTLVVMVGALEIYQGVGRYTSGERDAKVVRRYASTAMWWALACYSSFAVVCLVLAQPISAALLSSPSSASVVRVAVLWTAVAGILSVTQAQLRWQLRPKAFAAVAIINVVLTAGVGLALVFLAHLGVTGVIWGQLLGCAAALVVVLLLTRDIFRRTFDRAALQKMLRYSAPLVISSAGVFLNLYADRFVIQHFRSLSDVGLYGVGNRVAMLVMLLLMGFQGAAAPLFLSRRDEPSTPSEIARIFRWFVAISIVMLLTLSIFAAPILRVLAAAPYQSADHVVPFLVLATLFANMYMFAPGLAVAERTHTMAKLTGIAGVANLLLAVALVPVLGIVGAALGTAVTSVAWFVALMRASQRYYPVPHRWKRLAQAYIVAIGVVAAAFALLPQSRDAALQIGTLAARVGLLAAGVAACTTLCLGADGLLSVKRAVAGALGSRTEKRQPASVGR